MAHNGAFKRSYANVEETVPLVEGQAVNSIFEEGARAQTRRQEDSENGLQEVRVETEGDMYET